MLSLIELSESILDKISDIKITNFIILILAFCFTFFVYFFIDEKVNENKRGIQENKTSIDKKVNENALEIDKNAEALKNLTDRINNGLYDGVNLLETEYKIGEYNSEQISVLAEKKDGKWFYEANENLLNAFVSKTLLLFEVNEITKLPNAEKAFEGLTICEQSSFLDNLKEGRLMQKKDFIIKCLKSVLSFSLNKVNEHKTNPRDIDLSLENLKKIGIYITLIQIPNVTPPKE